MSNENHMAPGAPGIPSTWTSSAKSGIGKALSPASAISFTIGHGILNEVYYPREDIACTRDLGLVITDGVSLFCEEKKDTDHLVTMTKEGIPAYEIRNTCKEKRFVIEKRIVVDPVRDTLLQRVRFKPRKDASQYRGAPRAWKLFVLLTPHVDNRADGNTGWIDDYKGVPMLFASRDGIVLAMACSSGWKRRSAGFTGVSDGWTDLERHKQMEWEYARAEKGNISLTGEIDLEAGKEFVLAIGFGRSAAGAANRAWSSLLNGFDPAWDQYITEWKEWQAKLKNAWRKGTHSGKAFRTSASVLRMNEAKTFPGGVIASLSIPWGQSHGDEDLGGYHLVWPRDLVESSWGLLAIHAYDDALRILNYVMSTQDEEGKWPQNMWLEGEPYYSGVQMDQVALPILLAESCHHTHIIEADRMHRYWPIIRKAAAYLILHGPRTPQDRWEQQPGFTPFTLAVEISALLAAASLADLNNEPGLGRYFRETADYWNDHIEHWTYVSGTKLAEILPVQGYYIRVNPFDEAATMVTDRKISVHHRKDGSGGIPVGELVSVDALALVRFGLRAADDARILDTVRAIDAKLKVETPTGTCWRRFVGDSYGEDMDGNPFHTDGIGRAWPLLTGERAHYELAAGNLKGAQELLRTMESFAHCGLLPEQVWDTTDIPDKHLYRGKYTGSAMPLTWAHAEHIKLCKSLKDERIFDMPRHTYQRYVEKTTTSPFYVWRFERGNGMMSADKILRIEVLADALVLWTADGWTTKTEIATRDTGIGIHVADIHPNGSATITFTFFWKSAGRWENRDFSVKMQ